MNEQAAEAIISLHKHGYVCNPDPPYPGGLEGFEQDLKQLFSQYFDPAHVQAEFALPSELQQFLLAIEGSYYRRNSAGLFAMGSILSTTKYQLKLWEPEGEPALMWIEVGNWSDKHQLIMCVNRSSPYFGKVLDMHDEHPYCNDDFYIDEEYESIYHYARYPN
jgi:hypothetical protein